MVLSPFGPEHVQHSWPYLGVVAGPSRSDGFRRKARAEAIWKPTDDKVAHRGGVVATVKGPSGMKGELWNAYVVSLTPYPAQVSLPPAGVASRMCKAWRRTFPTGRWASMRMVTSLCAAYRVRWAPQGPSGLGGRCAAGGLGPRGHGAAACQPGPQTPMAACPTLGSRPQ